MNIHEFQAKQLFRDYGIPVPNGAPAITVAEAIAVARELGPDGWMVKAQVHAGGRGKAGGVKRVASLEELEQVCNDMLGIRLVTHQTDASGQPVETLLIEQTSQISRELYFGMLVDRACKRIIMMASTEGGMDIETVAAETPDKILSVAIDPVAGLQGYQIRELGFGLGLGGEQIKALGRIMHGLYRLFCEKDASLVEINPLIVTADNALMALDAKITFDDNALYRHADITSLRDATQEDEKEHHAAQFGLNYISLDGNIACMVNGAGLAMATMDIIKLHGGEPANFLDVGGGTNVEKVAEAFKLILSDEKVRAILVNIFGGIVRCDLIAEGVIAAVREVGIGIPVVVRLEGTNVEQGRRLLEESGLAIITATDLDDAATKAVAAAGAAA
ncbi:MAG: ADP-forming succinate--CoA ligase subunit beta [Granulosicoccaceae bacterium]|jgi:succinyl-CoA synthetase beta subunit